MKNNILTLAAIVALAFTTSCKKDKKQEETPKTQTELLTQAEWKVIKTEETLYLNDTLNDQEVDFDQSLKVKFNTDNTVSFAEEGEDPEVSFWNLSNDFILIEDAAFTILALTETELTLQAEEKGTDPDVGKYRFLYTIYMTH